MRHIYLAVERGQSTLAVMNGGMLEELLVEGTENEERIGCIYKGVVKNTLPSVNGIFIDIGIGQNAFLRTKDLLPGSSIPTEGDTLLVQVVKEGTDFKGPLVTACLNLSVTYGVAMAGSSYIGVSKKIRNEEKRERLRNIAKKNANGQFGVIIRTAAEHVDDLVFEKDMKRLWQEWDILQKRYVIEKAPALLWREKDIVVKALHDFATDDTAWIETNDQKTYDRLCAMNETEQILQEEQIQWKPEGNLLCKEGIEEEIKKLLDRRVELKSGGFLIIDPTEAMTVIDVNSGGFQGRGIPHEELAYLINKEAAVEIARQIKLRSIGGIILIDFIDMKQPKQKEKLLQILKEETRKDKEKTVVLGLTALGLLEMTRKRTGRKLSEFYYEPCDACAGTGQRLSSQTIVQRIYRELMHRERGDFSGDIEILCHPEIAAILKNEKEQEYLSHICHRNVTIKENNQLRREVYSLLRGEG